MDVDPMEYAEQAKEDKEAHEKEQRRSRLNTVIAVTVALLATFMALCKVKDDNIVQAMQQAQADKLDYWSWYQARKIRADVAEGTADQLRLQAAAQPASRALFARKAADYQRIADEQNAKQKDAMSSAKSSDDKYNALNYHDDQFDLSDAALSLAIALLALTSLTQKRWLFGFATIPIAIGVIMGLAGIFGWHLHSDLLARWLS